MPRPERQRHKGPASLWHTPHLTPQDELCIPRRRAKLMHHKFIVLTEMAGPVS